MTIGEKLKAKRQEAKLSQQALAEKLHVSRQTISSWEVGRTYPDLDILVTISEIYQIPLDDLLKEDSNMVEEITQKVKVSERRKIVNIILAVLLILMMGTSLYMFLQNRQNAAANEQGLRTNDIMESSWELNYTLTNELIQSMISFSSNSIVVYNDFEQGIEQLDNGMEDGSTLYEDLSISLDGDTYVVEAQGYSERYTRLSDTILRDSNGNEYRRVSDHNMNDSLLQINGIMEEEHSTSNE